MDSEDGFVTFLLIILVVVAVSVIISIVVGIFYCLTLQKALNRCSPQNRAMSPGLVWLFLIPVFNLVWHFFIVLNMAKSLHAEFLYRGIVEEPNPGQGIGLAACILHVVSNIPYLGGLAFIGFLVCWIIYWIKIAGYSGKIALPYRAPEPQLGAAPVA
jgi:hypothetical protein